MQIMMFMDKNFFFSRFDQILDLQKAFDDIFIWTILTNNFFYILVSSVFFNDLKLCTIYWNLANWLNLLKFQNTCFLRDFCAIAHILANNDTHIYIEILGFKGGSRPSLFQLWTLSPSVHCKTNKQTNRHTFKV